MDFRKALIIIILLAGLLAFFVVSKMSGGKLASPQLVSQNRLSTAPTPTLTPTPTPIIIDLSSNLEEETQDLTPEDFSGDFKTLKEEAGKL